MGDLGTTAGSRPRLLLLRSLREDLPPFLTAHFAERVRCLSQSFTVIEHAGGGDLGAICDASRPDLIMLELGADTTWPRLTNLSAHGDVPRVGFLNADPFDVARAAFVSAAEELGVETYFTHSVSMGEYTPEFVDRMFFWPNFIEPEIFHPYDVPKTTQLLFSGSRAALYPWRSRTRALLEGRYPSATMEHFGWSGSAANRMPTGADYARLLAEGRFVPACGAIGREVVRKHLEIPAVGTCLIAESSESLRAFGFVDMGNSILGDGPELFEKIDHLIADEDAYRRVIHAGSTLVSSRHTISQRTQVHDWFVLNREGHRNHALDQDGPTGAVRLRETNLHARDRVTVSGGVDRRHLRSGWECLAAGDIAGATVAFERCLSYTYIAEAVIGLTHCLLTGGRPEAADARLRPLWTLMSEGYGPLTPDPVVIATMIRVRLCQDDVAGAVALSEEYRTVEHPELSRIRSALFAQDRGIDDARLPVTPSICPPPAPSAQTWRDQLAAMLIACGRERLIKALILGKPLAHARAGPLSRSASSARRAFGHAARTAVRTARETVRRCAQPVKRRWSSTPWAADLAEAIHKSGADRLLLVGARRTSIPQRVLGWIVWSTDIEVVTQPSIPVPSATATRSDLLYIAGLSLESFDPETTVGASTSVVVLERPSPQVTARTARQLDALGFGQKDSVPRQARPIRVFVR